MKRIHAIQKIMQDVTNEFVIASCGMISREVYFVRDRPENFYVMGSMGAAVGVGIGLALNIERRVLVIAGDGEVLMSLGTLVLMNKLKLSNLRVSILDNNIYQTTGGQKTCSNAIDLTQFYGCSVFKIDEESDFKAPRVGLSHERIAQRFYDAINSSQ